MFPRTLIAACLACSCQLAQAADLGQRAADEAAIRRAVESYTQAFNRADAQAVASHWSDGGEYLSPSGERFKGRDAIQKAFAAYFAAGKGLQVEVPSLAVRFLTPDVAIEEGIARVTRPGQEPGQTSYLAIHVKKDKQWKLDSVRETVVTAEPSHYEQLRELEWMIGQWVDQGKDSTIETVCQWTKNKNFLMRSFKVSTSGGVALEGTQVIGWDAEKRQIRSWVFDSDGGFGEGAWTHKGDQWTVKTSHLLAGGEKGSSVNVFTLVDENTYRWRSVGREIDGQIQPDIPEVIVVRQGAR